jgi:hypothetical protein
MDPRQTSALVAAGETADSLDLGKFPLLVAQRAYVPRLQPALDAVQMEYMSTAPCAAEARSVSLGLTDARGAAKAGGHRRLAPERKKSRALRSALQRAKCNPLRTEVYEAYRLGLIKLLVTLCPS